MAQLNEESVQEIAAEGQEVELTPEQKKEQLDKLMADGKRELDANNLETASQKFGDAAEFAAQQYGPLAEESFEPNFMHARVLVKRGEEKKKSEGTEEESKEEKTDEKAQGDKAEEESKEEKAEDSKEEKAEDSKEKAEEKTEEETKDEKTEEETKEEKKPTDNLDNNKLAWKSLEVAKNIADKMIAETSSSEWKTKKADVEDLVAIIKDGAEDSKESSSQKQQMATLNEKTETLTVLTASNGQTDSTANDISSPAGKKRVHDETETEGDAKRKKSEGVEEMGDENIAV